MRNESEREAGALVYPHSRRLDDFFETSQSNPHG